MRPSLICIADPPGAGKSTCIAQAAEFSGGSVFRLREAFEVHAHAILDWTVIQHGDPRCNRAAYGFYVGPRWHPFLSGRDPRDLDTRDAFLRYFGGVSFTGAATLELAGKLVRSITRHPVILVIATRWVVRTLRRVGGARAILRHGVAPVSFVVHQFMDAADVAPAWELMRRGEKASDPRLLATQQRLASCHYAMAHPAVHPTQDIQAGELVPACVQHCVLTRPRTSSCAGCCRSSSAPRRPAVLTYLSYKLKLVTSE
ncbi:MAG: hypothetical protein ACRDRS_15385 [Pseudonocardiaceae bacterium]